MLKMLLLFALALLFAQSSGFIQAANLTFFNEMKHSASFEGLRLRTGTFSSSTTCRQAFFHIMTGRTGGMVFIKDEALFNNNNPGYSLCLIDNNTLSTMRTYER